MPTIHLTTFIQAPISRVFDLSRSIELHKKSMEANDETVIQCSSSNLMKLNDTVTWSARHLGKRRMLTVKIIAISFPDGFTDEMQSGDFKSLRHEHHFKEVANGTIMIDLFYFESPYGLIGQVFNNCYLTNYMKKLLQKRNATIKNFAESNAWESIIVSSAKI